VTTGLDVIPLAKPMIGDAEEQAVLEVLRSGQLSLGPHVAAFERAFAERVGARHACAVSSACTWRCAPSASARATRSSRRRSRSSRPPTRRCSRARGRCSPTSTR
jgi:DegT/DnrJ/EryC1/StrS aminotransferase family